MCTPIQVTLSIIFCFLSCPSSAVELPGSDCPVTPETHDPNDLPWPSVDFYHTLVGVPYSSSHYSPLFKDINAQNAATFFTYITRMDRMFVLSLFPYERNDLELCGMEAIIQQHRPAKSFYAQSQINSGTVPCSRPLMDKIKLWFDGDFLIIWDCRTLTLGSDKHDEAVLMTIRTHNRTEEYKHPTDSEVMRRLRASAEKFLGRPLLERIKWEDKVVTQGLSKEEAMQVLGCPCGPGVEGVRGKEEVNERVQFLKGWGMYLVCVVSGMGLGYLVSVCVKRGRRLRSSCPCGE